MQETRSINDFFNNEYKEYGKYVVEHRALPSIVDGLKPTARKILFSALKTLKIDQKDKMVSLAGSVMKESAYDHGDSSLYNGIINLSNEYSDNFAPFTIVGSGGSLRSNETAAPRYLKMKLLENAKLYLHDSEILTYNYDGDQQTEPHFYLPIIPLVLAKRDQGIALGYSFNNSLSFHPIDIIDNCISIINEKKIKPMRPHVIQYDGTWELTEDKRYKSKAHVQIEKNKLIFTSLPVDQTFDSFEKNLVKKLEAGTITDWENLSEDDNIKYIVHVNPSKLERIKERNLLGRIFKTEEYVKRPTLTMLDEHGKVIQFKNAKEVIQYFVKYRLSKYSELKNYKIKKFTEKLAEYNMIRKFIDLYLKGTIKLGKDISLAYVKKSLKKHKIAESVLSMPINRLTKEEYDKLTNKISELEKDIKYITETSAKDLYLNDLKALRKQYENKFSYQEFKTI